MKKSLGPLLALTCALSPSALAAGGGGGVINDECANAITIFDGPNGTFSNLGSSTSAPSWPCALGGSDVWFVYTATCDGTATISLCSQREFDTAIEAFAGSCGALTSLGCNDDACGLVSEIAIAVTLGNSYYVRVGGFSGATGNFTVDVTCQGVPRPANDECSGAIPLSVGTNGPFDNRDASDSPTGFSCTNGGKDVWFSFQNACDGDTTISLCTGSTFDTTLAVFTGDCGAGLTEIACNDDFCGLVSELTFPLVANTTYYIAVGGFAGDDGDFQIELSTYAPGTGTIDVLPTGCGANLQVTGTPTQGTQMSFALTNVGFGQIPVLWFGAQTSLVLCPAGCEIGAELAIVATLSGTTFDIPCDLTIAGAELCVQGAIGNAFGGCTGALNFTVSDTYCLTVGGN